MTWFLKIVVEHEVGVFIFSTTFVWNISHPKNWAKYDQKWVLVFIWSTCYSCQILMKLEFFSTDFWQIQTSNFMEVVQWKLSCFRWTDIQTNRCDIANSHFFAIVQTCLKILYVVCPKRSCSMFIKIVFYKFKHTSMWSPSKYSPLDTIHLSHLRSHCWKYPWNSSSLKPFSSDVVSLLIVVTSPKCHPAAPICI